jgi:hypothetical protein
MLVAHRRLQFGGRGNMARFGGHDVSPLHDLRQHLFATIFPRW